MQPIGTPEIKLRIQRDNPWWANANLEILEAKYEGRVYFPSFKALALNFDVRRFCLAPGA